MLQRCSKKFSRVKKRRLGVSLVAQWLRIRLPMQGTQVWALVWEDPTCRGATKPVCHNYWACALEPASHGYWAHVPRARALQQEKPLQWEAHALQRRVAPAWPTRESRRAATKTQRSQKFKEKKNPIKRKKKKIGLRVMQTWVQIPALSFSGCVTSGKLLSLYPSSCYSRCCVKVIV